MITVDRLDLFAPIDLASVVDSANLQTRIDSKYLLAPDAYGRFCDRLARLGDWRCLEIGGRRRFAYESIYFDTPELLTYRQHRQGRRHRFKVRSRTYADSGECAFEVKLKGARADTVKERMEYRAADAGRLAPDAAEFLAATLRRAYGMAVPLGMAPRVRTDYRRHTLVDLDAATRITCDEELTVTGATGRAAARRVCLVEVKSAQAGGPVDRMLWQSGARPVSVSKYCLAAAALYPWLGANPWARAYKECFGPEAPGAGLDVGVGGGGAGAFALSGGLRLERQRRRGSSSLAGDVAGAPRGLRFKRAATKRSPYGQGSGAGSPRRDARGSSGQRRRGGRWGGGVLAAVRPGFGWGAGGSGPNMRGFSSCG